MADLVSIVNQLSRYFVPAASAIDKAKLVYDWVVKNIEYDQSRADLIKKNIDDGIPYHPAATVKRGRGVCTDLAMLYISIARDMGVKAHFADVKVDHHGQTVCHACVAIDTAQGRYLVDPAYNKFDIKHKEYHIIADPLVKLEDGRIVSMKPKRKNIRRIAASILATIVGIGAYAVIPDIDLRSKKVTYLPIDAGAKFVSQTGVLTLKFDKETSETIKEYFFFSEAKEGRLNDKGLLGKLLLADADNNSTITIQEAKTALSSAREAYSKKD